MDTGPSTSKQEMLPCSVLKYACSSQAAEFETCRPVSARRKLQPYYLQAYWNVLDVCYRADQVIASNTRRFAV